MKLVPGIRQASRQFFFARLEKCSTPLAVMAAPTLIIAPHPDDETLGCGGLIALKRAMGAPVSIIFLTQGESGPGQNSQVALETLRRTEAAHALQILDVDPHAIYFWNYPDAFLADLPPQRQSELVTQLADFIRQWHIAEVFVTHRGDGHPDHEAAFRATHSALVIARQTIPTCRLFEYPIWLAWLKPVTTRLRPSCLKGARTLAIASVLPQKSRAIAAYASQIAAFHQGFLNHFRSPTEIFFEADGAP